MEELYRSLYTKYAMGLSEDEINNRVQYALQQDPSEFINAFYKKYTGGGPSADQVNYINSIISQPQQPQTIPDINFEDKEEKQEMRLQDARYVIHTITFFCSFVS